MDTEPTTQPGESTHRLHHAHRARTGLLVLIAVVLLVGVIYWLFGSDLVPGCTGSECEEETPVTEDVPQPALLQDEDAPPASSLPALPTVPDIVLEGEATAE